MSPSTRRQRTCNHRTRVLLDTLLKQLLQDETQVLEDGHLSLDGYNDITHIIDYDFEDLSMPSSASKFPPEVLFEPMVEVIGQSRDTSVLARPFPDLPEEPTRFDLMDSIIMLCDFIVDYTDTCVFSPPAKLRKIFLPCPIYLDLRNQGCYPDDRPPWAVEVYLEPVPEQGVVFPHLTILALQPKAGWEHEILYGELIALVSAMRSRAFQVKIDTKKEQEEFLDAMDVERKTYPYLFPEEETFPTLLLSAVEPRHARIIYGCMEGRRLVIRQSKLYSFVRGNDSPVEFFASLWLSRPVVRDSP
ncbi:uncharacterized protein BO97DRAFT_456888 [Aspergillus homomorphus CBS 101889]|uniref:Uncharacterized protein n=1 Tax=Aspergillus homomorphus (strain CBS 101889) TaxID=1450537 RepID=A0A395HQZ4_ASPHC|nr:hypothetical protein BO97DRAFT_456888 [Aspergillus homomorphus CBS 101889]RAL10237.1 hypothetical protein BO97DRAFT_456888 [Aspergillus homomorphus CBS 101889]